MGLASDLTERRTVPSEVNPQTGQAEWMEFRELGVAELRRAKEVSRRAQSADIRDMGHEIYGEMLRFNAPRSVVDPFRVHDQDTLLEAGLVSWSYATPLPPQAPENRQRRIDLIGRLKERTAEWAARTILEISDVDNAWNTESGVIEAEAVEAGVQALPDPTETSSYVSTDG